MTKKSIALSNRMVASAATEHTTLFSRLARLQAVVALAGIYSAIMEERISPQLTLHLLNAQMAAFVALLPATLPLTLRLVCFLWAALALTGCREAYRHRERG